MSPQRKRTSSLKVEQKPDELQFMSNPGRWPAWPWLPLKKSGTEGLVTGFIHADAYPNQPTKVYSGNLFQIHTYFPTPEMEVHKEYPDFNAILADGWEID